jgi:hypothetical protein
MAGRGKMMRFGFHLCAIVGALVLASPVGAQQTAPAQPAPAPQQTTPAEPAPPPADMQTTPQSPPPFPPMPRAAPRHRWVNAGTARSRHEHRAAAQRQHAAGSKHHATASRHHAAASRHHAAADRRQRSSAPDRRASRRCHHLSYRQMLRDSGCRAVVEQDLRASERSDHRTRTSGHHDVAREHQHGRDRHRSSRDKVTSRHERHRHAAKHRRH